MTCVMFFKYKVRRIITVGFGVPWFVLLGTSAVAIHDKDTLLSPVLQSL